MKYFCCILLFFGFGCSPEEIIQVPRHFILITVDTLRTDHLGCYGNPEIYTPNIDMIAENGVLFETCIVPMGKTTPSLASLLTAKYPHEHTVRSIMKALPKSETTLTEIL